MSRVVQRTLGKYADSRGMYMDLSRGMKVNEFADLTSREFVSEYTEEKPNMCVEWS